ncbi:MAG: hypothetical protein HY791_34080 [Deltaproteobacteria bacterium]|nr:hypothetical protein [Deltaproteobacteria bacterium]
MPITPFHLGPALTLKAIAPRFSLGAFALVQGIIDVESVGNILLSRFPIHATLFTFAGSFAVAAIVSVVGAPALRVVYRWLRPSHGWYREQLGPPSRREVIVGAVLGAVLHVVPDAMMHPDLHPFGPWSTANPFLFEGGFGAVHLVWGVLSILGFAAWRARRPESMTPNRPADQP